jgi:hypothetical protein
MLILANAFKVVAVIISLINPNSHTVIVVSFPVFIEPVLVPTQRGLPISEAGRDCSPSNLVLVLCLNRSFWSI